MKEFEIFKTFGNPATTKTTLSRAYYVPVDKYQCYKFWSFPLKRSNDEFKDLKLLTAMGNGNKNGMVMKVFGTSRPPQKGEPSFIPEPVDYNTNQHYPPKPS